MADEDKTSTSASNGSDQSQEDAVSTIPSPHSPLSQKLSFESVLIFLANMLLLLKSTADAQTKTDSFVAVNGMPESVGFPLVFANILTKLLRQKDNNDLSATNSLSAILADDDFVKNKLARIKELNKNKDNLEDYKSLWENIEANSQYNEDKRQDLLFAWWLLKDDKAKKHKYFLKWFSVDLSVEENQKELEIILDQCNQFFIKKESQDAVDTGERHNGSDDFRARLMVELYTPAEKFFVWFIKNICARLNNFVFSSVPAYQTYIFLPKLIAMLVSGSPAFWVMAVASWIYLGYFLYKKFNVKGLIVYTILTAALAAALYFLGPIVLIAAPITLIAAKAYDKAAWKGLMFVGLLVALAAVTIMFAPPVVFPIMLAISIFGASWWNSKNTVNFKFDKNHQRFFSFIRNFELKNSLQRGWKHVILALCAISTAPFLYMMLKALVIGLLKAAGGALCAAILVNPYIIPIIIGITVALTVFISVKVIWERIEKTRVFDEKEAPENFLVKRIMTGIGVLFFTAVIAVSVIGDYSGFLSLFKNIPVAVFGAIMSAIYNTCSSYRLVNDFSNYKPTLFGGGMPKSATPTPAQSAETKNSHRASD